MMCCANSLSLHNHVLLILLNLGVGVLSASSFDQGHQVVMLVSWPQGHWTRSQVVKGPNKKWTMTASWVSCINYETTLQVGVSVHQWPVFQGFSMIFEPP